MARPRHSSRQVASLLGLLAAEPARWRYGYELAVEAAISAGTLYPALARLADDGLLEARWELPSAGGHPRHLYRLTANGVSFASAHQASRHSPPRRVTPGLASP